MLTCLSPDGLVSFFTERFPSTLKFALPWDDFKTAKLRKNKNSKQSMQLKSFFEQFCRGL